jgi:hypothetical protein
MAGDSTAAEPKHPGEKARQLEGGADSAEGPNGGTDSHEQISQPSGEVQPPASSDDHQQGEGSLEGFSQAPATKTSEDVEVQQGDAPSNGVAVGASIENHDKKQKKKRKRKKVTYYSPYDLDERDEDENTPLHIAIHACKLEHVKLLLEAGASHARKCDGSFPVHTAISMGALSKHADFAHDCVALLVGHGADLSLKDDSFHTPLYLACVMNGYIECESRSSRWTSFACCGKVRCSTLSFHCSKDKLSR